MKNYVIAYDIGGTSIKAGLVDSNLELEDCGISIYPSKSQQDADTIIDNILDIAHDQWSKINCRGDIIIGLSFAFPGPFDYQRGISYMKELGKFDSIYGLEIDSYLKRRILNKNIIGFNENLKFNYVNDAAAFALGEYYRGKGMECEKLMCITLGTGCGSAFLKQGEIVRGDSGIPANGMVFDQPFRGKIIDEFVSRRGILKLAEGRGFNTSMLDVADLDTLARSGDENAKAVFYEFGKILGEALNPFICKFEPDAIILGGRISKGYDLFSDAMQQELINPEIEVKISDNLSKSALIGVASRVFKQ